MPKKPKKYGNSSNVPKKKAGNSKKKKEKEPKKTKYINAFTKVIKQITETKPSNKKLADVTNKGDGECNTNIEPEFPASAQNNNATITENVPESTYDIVESPPPSISEASPSLQGTGEAATQEPGKSIQTIKSTSITGSTKQAQTLLQRQSDSGIKTQNTNMQSKTSDLKQQLHDEHTNQENLRPGNTRREFGTNNTAIEVKKKTPTITPEQLEKLSFPNCPLPDFKESQKLSANTQKPEQPTKVVTKDQVSNLVENSSVKKKTQMETIEDDDMFVDALETLPLNQPSTSSVKLSAGEKTRIQKVWNNMKTAVHGLQKKDTDPNRLICSDKKQYIKKKFIDGNLYYSAKFLSHYSILVAEGEVSYEILGKKKLLIADSDNFIARIEIVPGEELDFKKSFRQNKAILINRVTIVKVLEDELLVQRNEVYNVLKEILEVRSGQIPDYHEFAEDFLQMSVTLKTYYSFRERPHLLLQEILKNQYVSHDLKCVIEQLVNFEISLQKRNKLFPKCTCASYFSLQDLFPTMQEKIRNGLRIHKQNLIKKCSTQNSYLLCRILEINKLPVEKLLRITNNDIKLFTDLMSLTNVESNTIIPLEFIDNLWSHFYRKLSSENCKSLKDSGTLSHPIYFFLVKSLRDLIIDIISKSTMTAQELFKKENGVFTITNNISWLLNSSANLSLENQYKLVYKLMKHFEPGKYTNKEKFKYKFALLENNVDSSFFHSLKSLVFKSRNDLLNMPEERLIWLYIVDAGIASILSGESNERFKNLSLALLTGFLNFVSKAKHVRYESFRIAAHNIVKFATQILPYFNVTNSLFQDLDHSILDKQINFINIILSPDEGDNISNLFSILMEVYIEYWELRESIIEKLKIPCTIFRGLVDDIILKLLEIVDNTLSKPVELQLIIRYFRLFNEFVKHFKGINFAWLISKNFYFADMNKCVKEIKKGDKITYEVSEPEKFLDILKEKDKEPPKHFLIETVLELLKIINFSLDKSNWSDENRLKAAGDLFLAIGHSFAHFEDQTDYTDIELFLRDCTRPYKSVVENSLTYSDFKIRLDNVENYYLYARKQNQIGIHTALDLCVKEVEKARENGFHTSINREILEQCFNRYSDKLLLLQNLDIPAILKDLKEQMKNVDILPLERWTPHFKQTRLPVLLANLSAIWTILESKDVAKIEKRLEPHCIQIICILRLVGVDHLENGIPKHFAQVLTGQGKSIILGLLASLITLTGQDANVVCYSRYLAARDKNAFDVFFQTFKKFTKGKKINYYTFYNMAEDALTRKINGEEVSLRNVVRDLILNKLDAKSVEKVENLFNAVLLIDEADVFFSTLFYGQTYNPCSTLGMAALKEIQPKLWEIVEGGVYEKNIVLERIREFINELLKEEKYEDFKSFLSCTSTFFEINLDQMVTTAIAVSKGKDNPEAWFNEKYKIDYSGIICYRERTGIYCSNTYIGYNNVFNYFKLKKSNFEDKNFKNYGYFFFIWGHISYSILPLAYKNILGVSGTLMTLNDHEKSAIKRYGIQTMSAMPSFFGERKLRFIPREHVSILDSVSAWHSKIFDHVSKTIENNRSVLVFFETDSEITEFENKYRNSINRLYTLIGNEEPETMEWRINEAGVAQTVTIATRAMGRGIDYKSNDRSVEEKGGIHVIQTFFSLDVKEETQLKGRTARKDNDGSYELILCREHLKEIECNVKSDGTLVNNYEELCDARLVKSNLKGAMIETRIRDSEKEHNSSMDFCNSITKCTAEEREKLLSMICKQ